MGYVITVLAILGIIIIVLEWLWNVTKAVASSIWHLMKNIAHVLWLPLVIALIIVILWQVINRLIEKRVSVKSDICRRLKELLEEAQQLPKPMNMDLTSQPLKVSAGELPEEIFFIEKHSEIQKQIDLVMNNRQQCASIREKYYCILQEYEEQVKYIKPHRVLAINRGEKEGILSVKINFNQEQIEDYLKTKMIKNKDSLVCTLVIDSIKDSLKRLIIPSIEREIRSELTEKADEVAIDSFGKNLEKLLLQPHQMD